VKFELSKNLDLRGKGGGGEDEDEDERKSNKCGEKYVVRRLFPA
jgi:hypothetical protein